MDIPSNLSQREQTELLKLLEQEEKFFQYNKLSYYFQDKDVILPNGNVAHSRHKYPKYMRFFEAGKVFKERALVAANRVGKTFALCTELTYHLTGEYPKWWPGKKFFKPINVLLLGVTSRSTRDVLQKELFGKFQEPGTGSLPKDKIIATTPFPGVPNGISYAKIKHVSGGTSEITFASYEQGMRPLMGTQYDIVGFDEEPPADVYAECITRTMTTAGIIIATFTPLQGMSDVVMGFLPGNRFPEYTEDFKYIPQGEETKNFHKFTMGCTWDDVPHLSEEQKKLLWESYPPNQRSARAKGIPALGEGRVYPIDEDEIMIDPFEIPDHWPRCVGLDVGWNRTAAVWVAKDPKTEEAYIYSEYYRGQAEPSVHAHGIRSRGDWIPVVIDPASRGRSQVDGQSLLDLYIDLGLDIYKADNSVDSGIYDVYQRLSSGKLKVFKTCQNWFQEFRLYQYDKSGRVLKKNDHLMDATRYAVRTGLDIAIAFKYTDNKGMYKSNIIDPIAGY